MTVPPTKSTGSNHHSLDCSHSATPWLSIHRYWLLDNVRLIEYTPTLSTLFFRLRIVPCLASHLLVEFCQKQLHGVAGNVTENGFGAEYDVRLFLARLLQVLGRFQSAATPVLH